MPPTKTHKELSAEEKQAAAAARSIIEEKIKELTENMTSTAGKFDSDYYGFTIENLTSDDFKGLPLLSKTGNIISKKDQFSMIFTPSCGPFSECDYYKTSVDEDSWNTPGGISVTFDNMPAKIREFIKQKREEKIEILAVKIAELDGYGKKKRSTAALIAEHEKRQENPESGKIKVNCVVYDKSRKMFVYLGNLEMISMETYELKIPKTKHSMNVEVFYLIA